MIRLILSVLVISFGYSSALYATDVEIDTTKREVGPGFTHMEITKDLPDELQRINVLKMDITREENQIETAMANDELGGGTEHTTSMSQRNSEDGNIVFGALNGDYFGQTTNPFEMVRNNHIEDGEFVFGKSYFRSQFGVENGTTPFINILDFHGYVSGDDDDDLNVAISGVNQRRADHEVVIYTEKIGSTRTDDDGIEIELSFEGDSMPMNSTTQATVEQIDEDSGDNEVPENRIILSAEGPGHETLQALEEGDQLELNMGTLAAPEGSVIAVDGEQAEISGYNEGRAADELILFDSHMGATTGTNEHGTEVRIVPTENDDIYEVIEIESGVGDMSIGEDEYILSGHGEAREFLDDHISEGDEITLDITMIDYDYISALIGGGPRLVHSG